MLVAAHSLERTGLLQIGSRVRYRTLARLPSEMAARAAAEDLARAIGDPTVRIAAFDESQPGLRRFFAQLATYLGLVGLASLLVALLCALWPLLAVRAVPPSLILRRDVDTSTWRARRPWAAALPILAGLAALAIWQAGSLRLGGIFVGAALAALAILFGLSRAVVTLARWVPRARGLAWRQGLAGLDRPGGHTVRVVVALGLGVMLLVAIALLEANLGWQLAYEQ